MQLAKKTGLGLMIAFIAIQFIRPDRNSSGQAMPGDIMLYMAVPMKVQALLKTSCYDCHSNNTRYPWYTNIQPIGWFLENHIRKAKRDLNFNEFATYSVRRQGSKFTGIAESMKEGTMPLRSYTLVHKDAVLSKEDKALIIEWANKSKYSLSSKIN